MFLFRILCTLELKALALHCTSSVVPLSPEPGAQGGKAGWQHVTAAGGRGVARDRSRGRGVVSRPDQTPAKGAKRQPLSGGGAPHLTAVFCLASTGILGCSWTFVLFYFN